MIKSILIAAFVGLVVSQEVQYNKDTECSIRGPVFWCKDLKTAEQCRATSYCSEHVWARTVKSSGLCTTCQQYVGTVHMLLANNSTQADILAGMKAACNLLPTSVKAMCIEAVDAYGKQMISMLVQYTANPKQLCTMIGLCNSTSNVARINLPLMTKIISEKVNADYCLTCEQYVGTVHMLIANNSTKADIVTGLKTLCGMMPSELKADCSLVVGWLVDWFVIYTADPSKFCTAIGLCKGKISIPLVNENTVKNVIKFHMKAKAVKSPKVEFSPIKEAVLHVKKSQPKGAVTCEVCTVAMTYLDNILKDKSTEAEVKQALDTLCGYLPSSYQTECTTLVNTYTDEIIILIMTEISNPAQVCKLLGLCTASNNKFIAKKISTPKSAVTCEVCEMVMQYLESLLGEKTTEAAVKAALDSVCGYLPSSYSAECKTLVNTYADEIIKLLVNELATPATLCKELTLCSSNEVTTKETVGNVITCEVCTMTMTYLDNMLKDKSTEAEVKQVLDSLCGHLPASYKSECTTLVNTYADEIINLIVSELVNPTTVCKELKLCTSSKKVIAEKISTPKSAVTCEVCEMVMQYLESLLGEKTAEAAVKAALDSVCGYLPSSYSAECKTFVNTYTDEIIKLLVNELATPATLCKELTLCASTRKAKKTAGVGNVITCEVCTMAMTYLDKILKDKSTEAEVKQALDSLCGYLPPAVKPECTTLVNTYADQMINLIVKELANPSTICKKLKLCTSSRKPFKKTVESSLEGTITCEICQYAMGKLDSILKKNSTGEEIKQAVEGLCAKLPTYMAAECKLLVVEYGDVIITLLVQEFTPYTICKKIGLCSTTLKTKNKHVLAMRLSLSGVSCSLCEYAMGVLDTLLENKTTKSEIEAAVEKLCGYLPSAFKNECDALITEYGDGLIDLLVKQIKPAAICKDLKLC